MTVQPPRVLFDTTVLWGAFHSPAGPNAKLLDLAAQRAPVLDGFITDAVGAEFWWRVTQQGVKGPGMRQPRTYTEDELAPFLEAYEPIFEPQALAQAPLGRSLGRYAGLVGLPLGEVLHHITGRDRAALLASPSLQGPMNFETVDTADLHVICGAIDNGADVLCTNDAKTLGYHPIGALEARTATHLATELGLLDTAAPATRLIRQDP
ncbi:MAG TPA: hypothetical protein VFT50_07705 [Baekduia sp.]|nr:hypothetical protein [Baekduia sp.]